MIFTRESYWLSNSDPKNVRKIKIKDLTDTHLVNILKWVKDPNHKYDNNLINIIEIEAIKVRKLSKEFINGAPYPYNSSEKDRNKIKIIKEDKIEKLSAIEIRLRAINGD